MNNLKKRDYGKGVIPYEEALIMKDLGFEEPCFKGYTEEHKKLISFLNTPTNTSIKNTLPTKPFTAPIYQQAFRWFRDNCSLDGWAVPCYTVKGRFFTYIIEDDSVGIEEQPDSGDDVDYITKEEAELACIRKLIKIVKLKQLWKEHKI